jgi:hypothetical protein
MASMANRTQWLDVARLRDNIAGNGHAMPIGLGKLFNSGVVREKYCVSPIFAFAQGSNVPISMGYPPTDFREDE